jgi:signal transduction histidine kinase
MLLFLVPSLAQVLLVPIAPRPTGVLVALLSVVPLAWRRTAPAAAAAVGTAAFLVPTHDGFLVLGYVVAAILFFSVGAYVERLRVVVLVTAWALAASAETLLWVDRPVEVLGSLLVVFGPVVAGRIVAAQRAQTRQLQRLTEELAVERARAEQSAIAEERARIARELHDVVGHEMTMIAIQSEAAAAALRTAPSRAAVPVEAIRETAHRATAEMRAILGVLGTEEVEPGSAVPGPAELEQLVERSRLLGVDCTLSVRGRPWADAPNTWLALVRIVRESLTNAGRHAPGAPVVLDVAWDENQVCVEVRNRQVATSHGRDGGAGSGLGSGLGVAGMAERTRLLGGRFEAAPEGDWFRVRAALPRPLGAPA